MYWVRPVSLGWWEAMNAVAPMAFYTHLGINVFNTTSLTCSRMMTYYKAFYWPALHQGAWISIRFRHARHRFFHLALMIFGSFVHPIVKLPQFKLFKEAVLVLILNAFVQKNRRGRNNACARRFNFNDMGPSRIYVHGESRRTLKGETLKILDNGTFSSNTYHW